MMDKLRALIESRRFWVAVASLIVLVLNALGLPIGSETVIGVVLTAASWIVGDSLRTTETEATRQMRMRTYIGDNHR